MSCVIWKAHARNWLATLNEKATYCKGPRINRWLENQAESTDWTLGALEAHSLHRGRGHDTRTISQHVTAPALPTSSKVSMLQGHPFRIPGHEKWLPVDQAWLMPALLCRGGREENLAPWASTGGILCCPRLHTAGGFSSNKTRILMGASDVEQLKHDRR